MLYNILYRILYEILYFWGGEFAGLG